MRKIKSKGGKKMEEINKKELSEDDNSLKKFIKLLILVFIIVGFSIGCISYVIFFCSRI